MLLRIVFLLGSLSLLAGCGKPVTPASDTRLPVFAGIPPIGFLVEQIGGPHVKVDVLVRPGQDPHTFEATPKQVAAISRAKLFFQVGMPFESVLLEKIQAGDARLIVVDVTHGVKKRPLGGPCKHEADHDHDKAFDPHVWLSPALLKIQAKNIAASLAKADPANEASYNKNLAALVERLDALDRKTREMLAPYRGRAFYVFHPGFGYFADAYGLKEEVVEVGGQEPSAKHLRELSLKAKAEGVKTIFVQPQYDPKNMKAIADALGGRATTINGLDANVLADIEDIAQKIRNAMKESDGK